MKTAFKKILCLSLAWILLLCPGCYVYTGEETQYSVYFYQQNGMLEDIKQPKGFLEQTIDLIAGNDDHEIETANPQRNHQNFDITIPTVILHQNDVQQLGSKIHINEHHFMGWSETQGSNEVKYQPGDSFSCTGETELYSVFSNDPETHADSLTLDKETLTITCKECEAKNPHVSLNTFSKLYHWRGADYDAWHNGKTNEIAKQYLIYLGYDALVLDYLMQFDMGSEEFNRLANIQKRITNPEDNFSTAASTLKTAVEIKADRSELSNGFASQNYITDEWKTTAGLLKFLDGTIQVSQAIQQLQALKEGEELPADRVEELIDVLQTYTAMLPDATYYGVMLNSLSMVMKEFFERYEDKQYLYDYYDLAIESQDPGDYILSSPGWNALGHKDRWYQGPALTEVARYYPGLSDTGKELLDDYIEFRIIYEFNEALAGSGFTFETYVEYLLNP